MTARTLPLPGEFDNQRGMGTGRQGDREGETRRQGDKGKGRFLLFVSTSPCPLVSLSPCPLVSPSLSTPVIIRGQRGGNSSSVVDTLWLRSSTPLHRSAAHLLLFIHLASLGRARLRVGTSVALLCRVERQKSFHSESLASLGIINRIFKFEPCLEGSAEFGSYLIFALRPEE